MRRKTIIKKLGIGNKLSYEFKKFNATFSILYVSVYLTVQFDRFSRSVDCATSNRFA